MKRARQAQAAGDPDAVSGSPGRASPYFAAGSMRAVVQY